MNIELNQDEICMKANQLVKVRGGIGHSVVCNSGIVWLTQDGDRRDVILRAGEAFTLDRKGPALLQAFEPSAVSITRAAASTRPGALNALSLRAVAAAGQLRGAVGA